MPLQSWGQYVTLDEVLYNTAQRRLDESLKDYPNCKGA